MSRNALRGVCRDWPPGTDEAGQRNEQQRKGTTMKSMLRNWNCVMEFDPERKEISGSDLTDQCNMPACYSKNKRGIAKSWAALEAAWNENMTMYTACHVLDDAGIRMHTWCMMD